MPEIVLTAIIWFSTALAAYSIGVWGEWFTKRLQGWHVAAFVVGVAADSYATHLMYKLVGHIVISAHSIVGAFSLLLMIFHLLWAVLVLWRGSEAARTSFHKFSMAVWLIWLLSYLSGMWLGMQRIG